MLHDLLGYLDRVLYALASSSSLVADAWSPMHAALTSRPELGTMRPATASASVTSRPLSVQLRVFHMVGVVASDSTCWRVLNAIGESDVAVLRGPRERQPISPAARRRVHRDGAAALHGCRADAGKLRVL